jgi:uncharacterized coiled-coil protein SlyX
MTIDRSQESAWAAKQERNRADKGMRGDGDPPLKGGGGDGTSGGMEERLARLEADMAHTRGDVSKLDSALVDVQKTLTAVQIDISKGVGEINRGIATLIERTKHFPTRWDVFLMLVAMLTAISVVAAFVARFIPSNG